MAENSKELNRQDTLKRVLAYVFKYYKGQFFLVLALILITALCMLQFTLFMQTLIDDYVTPLMAVESPDFSGLALLWKQGIFAQKHWQQE